MEISPCYGCKKRQPGCACDEYKEWVVKYRKAKQHILKETPQEKVLNEWRFDTIQKFKKRSKDKWRKK